MARQIEYSKLNLAVQLMMGNRMCDLGSIQTFITCVYEMVDSCICCCRQRNTSLGLVNVCLYMYMHICRPAKQLNTPLPCTHKVTRVHSCYATVITTMTIFEQVIKSTNNYSGIFPPVYTKHKELKLFYFKNLVIICHKCYMY